MGLEATCKVELKGNLWEGRAHCGDGEISFNGEMKFRWKWSDLTRIESREGILTVGTASEQAEFHLGPNAEKWEAAIRSPKSRLDKLGVKPGQNYKVQGEFDNDFLAELSERAGRPGAPPHDVVFLRLSSTDDFESISQLRETISPKGSIWAIWTKGQKALTENHVRDFALSNGLVDVKVASFSATLSALKLVIPVALRNNVTS